MVKYPTAVRASAQKTKKKIVSHLSLHFRSLSKKQI